MKNKTKYLTLAAFILLCTVYGCTSNGKTPHTHTLGNTGLEVTHSGHSHKNGANAHPIDSIVGDTTRIK